MYHNVSITVHAKLDVLEIEKKYLTHILDEEYVGSPEQNKAIGDWIDENTIHTVEEGGQSKSGYLARIEPMKQIF